MEHLRSLGIEPEAPNHPGWRSLDHLVGGDFIRAKTVNPTLLRDLPELGMPAAPFVITLYRWAAKEKLAIEPFKGSVNRDLRVQRAMQDYVLDCSKDGITNIIGDTIQVLATLNPFPKKFAASLDAILNNTNSHTSIRGWLAPLTGAMPQFDSWRPLQKAIVENYSLQASDVQVSGDKNDVHWSANHRMDLVLAAWMCEDLTYFATPLYSHLPNVQMDMPDAVTALFWTVALDYVETNPDRLETEMLSQWMQEFPEYLAFFQDNRTIVKTLYGNDFVVCAKALHQSWEQKQVLASGTPSIEGLLDP